MESLSSFYRSKKILVTGHTGFKGAWLALWLERLGATVIGFALPPKTAPNLFELAGLEKTCHHTIDDIRSLSALQVVLDTHRPDGVFHLAAQPLVRRSYAEPKYTFDVNAGGTVNVLEAIRNCSSVRFGVMVTTDKVYAALSSPRAHREGDPLGGEDLYSASKSAAEHAVAAYCKSFFEEGASAGIRPVGIASVRAGNVIGGGDWAEDRIIPDAVRAATKESTLMFRHPSAIRPWQYILDPLAGYLALGVALVEKPAIYQGGWNFGPDERQEITVQELVTLFYKQLGRGDRPTQLEISRRAVHETETLRLRCDKASAALGWHPTYDIAQAVDRTAAWYRRVMWENVDAKKECIDEIERFMEQATQQGQWWAA